MEGYERRNKESKTAYTNFTNKKGNWLKQIMPRLFDIWRWGKANLGKKKYKKRKLTEQQKEENKQKREKIKQEKLKARNKTKKTQQNTTASDATIVPQINPNKDSSSSGIQEV